jgi:hypothetical protein
MGILEGTGFVNYCLHGLKGMYMPSAGVFSTSYRMVDGIMLNVYERDSAYKFTMNTLMGLYKARVAGSEVFLDIETAYRSLAGRVREQATSAQNIAATVWAGHSIGVEVPEVAVSLFDRILNSQDKYPDLGAQGLAWTIAACVTGGVELREKAHALLRCATERYIHPRSMLVRHTPSGFRKDWASFAASCYMAYSLLLLARETGDQETKRIGLTIARAMVRLQGPQGQWAWFYHVPSGRVVDYYPVYSVHQHAMAPLFLLEAIDQGYAEFREPLVRGFRWIFGQNELQTSLVDRDRRIIWRSAVRREPLARMSRFARTVGVTYAGLRPGILDRDDLQINRECRSYELGWALWAFAGRRDFDEILNDPCFV